MTPVHEAPPAAELCRKRTGGVTECPYCGSNQAETETDWQCLHSLPYEEAFCLDCSATWNIIYSPTAIETDEGVIP